MNVHHTQFSTLFSGYHISKSFMYNPWNMEHTVYPKNYARGFCFAAVCCGYTLTDFPISIRLTSLALWQSNDCPSASKATLMNMDKNFMLIHYERLHNHNKAKQNKTVCIFLGIYCRYLYGVWLPLRCNPSLHMLCVNLILIDSLISQQTNIWKLVPSFIAIVSRVALVLWQLLSDQSTSTLLVFWGD